MPLLRLLLLLGACDFLPLTRRQFGFGFCLLLAGVYALKHQLLVYVPVAEGYYGLQQYAALAVGIHLLGRFFSARFAMRHVGVPGGYPGWPWLCYIGIPDRAARLYAEPLLALLVGFLAGQGRVYARFVPLFFLDGVLPLPYEEPYPDWYEANAYVIAQAVPVVSALALALFNRLDLPRPARPVTNTGRTLAVFEVRLPPAPRLPSPSAAVMARQLPQGGKRL
jgi:hypothetical protein